MSYIIVNNSTFEKFFPKAKAVAQTYGPISFSYVEHAENDGKIIPGGWGCIRFTNTLSENPVFASPDVEYRYSVQQDAWLHNGEQTEYSEWIKSLFEYFLSAPWNDL